MAERMTPEQWADITESVPALEYRLRYAAHQLDEARALVARLEVERSDLTRRLIAAHDAEEAD
jgi:hypothetical protein